MGFQCSIICFGCKDVLVMGAYIIMNCILWCLHRGFGEVRMVECCEVMRVC